MAELFKQQKAYIERIQNEEVLRLAVIRIEEVLLDEQIEWMASAKSGNEH